MTQNLKTKPGLGYSSPAQAPGPELIPGTFLSFFLFFKATIVPGGWGLIVTASIIITRAEELEELSPKPLGSFLSPYRVLRDSPGSSHSWCKGKRTLSGSFMANASLRQLSG